MGQHLLLSSVSYTLAQDGEHLGRRRLVAPLGITEFVFNPKEEINRLKVS